jgi:hypothetical protein
LVLRSRLCLNLEHVFNMYLVVVKQFIFENNLHIMIH